MKKEVRLRGIMYDNEYDWETIFVEVTYPDIDEYLDEKYPDVSQETVSKTIRETLSQRFPGTKFSFVKRTVTVEAPWWDADPIRSRNWTAIVKGKPFPVMDDDPDNE